MTVSEHTQSVSSALPLFTDLDFIPLTKRGISQDTCKAYGYGINKLGEQVASIYDEQGMLCAQHIRMPDKNFQWRGDHKRGLMFGSRLSRGQGKMLIIAEGEIDAMTIYESMGRSWPVWSINNGAGAASKEVSRQIEEIERYDKVVLAFDDDEAGQKALDETVNLLSPGKAHIMRYDGLKDANQLYKERGGSVVRQRVWDAKLWRPDGIVNLADLKERIRQRPTMGYEFPWPLLNAMLFGYRSGQVVTWTAGTGIGKTALVSEVAYHALVVQNLTVGLLYLEEGVDRAGQRIVGIEMNMPIHLPGTEFSDEEFDQAWDNTLGCERMFAYDHFGSLNADVLLARIRYLVKHCGCDVIFLDHISIVVSGNDLEDDERRTLDNLMTRLRQFTQETGACIHLVSHLRRPQGGKGHEEGRDVSLFDLRGTQAIAQLSDTVIAAERNQQAPTLNEQNVTLLRVLKNRFAGRCGPADRLSYDLDTGRFAPVDGVPPQRRQDHNDY